MKLTATGFDAWGSASAVGHPTDRQAEFGTWQQKVTGSTTGTSTRASGASSS